MTARAPMRVRIAHWRWLWKMQHWWFLRELPPEEIVTSIYTGFRGDGKTTFAVDSCIRFMRAGLRVYSNVYIRDTFSGSETRRVHSWLDVLEAALESMEDGEPCVIFLDELQRLCHARDWQKTPSWWLDLMEELRHMGVSLIGTTQNIGQVEIRLRMLIGSLIQVRPSFLRRLWRRWPRFVFTRVDMQVEEDPAKWMPPGRSKTIWMYSHAFHGHSTWELVAAPDFGTLTDEAIQKRIDALMDRARELRHVGRLPAFADELEGVA